MLVLWRPLFPFSLAPLALHEHPGLKGEAVRLRAPGSRGRSEGPAWCGLLGRHGACELADGDPGLLRTRFTRCSLHTYFVLYFRGPTKMNKVSSWTVEQADEYYSIILRGSSVSMTSSPPFYNNMLLFIHPFSTCLLRTPILGTGDDEQDGRGSYPQEANLLTWDHVLPIKLRFAQCLYFQSAFCLHM